MEEQTPPAISPRTRTAIYVGCLIANVAVVTGGGVATALGVGDPVAILGAGGAVLAGINLVSSGLAVGYRPTRPDTQA